MKCVIFLPTGITSYQQPSWDVIFKGYTELNPARHLGDTNTYVACELISQMVYLSEIYMYTVGTGLLD